jgi:hypothetical protein
MEKCGLDAYGSGSGPLAGSCEHGDGPSGSIKGRDFDWLSYYQILEEDSAPWSWL